MTPTPLTVAVFASGSGTNLQALLEHRAEPPGWSVGLVVSDRPEAGALERAHAVDVPTRVIPTQGRDMDDVGRQALDALRAHEVDLVLLAGYLKLVPPAVVGRYRGRMLNIHPALLPAFGGKGMYGIRVHRAVLESGVRVTGATVHLVDEVYDRGRILAQWPVPVRRDDTAEALAARVLAVEHRLYPLVVDHLARAVQGDAEIAPLSLAGRGFAATGTNEAPSETDLTDRPFPPSEDIP